MEVKGLAHFTAYCNKAIKVVFEDRTIVRMIYGSDVVRILTKLGEEVLVNLRKPKHHHAAAFSLVQEYHNYIKVAEEFFEWAFSSPEQRALKERNELENIEAVEREVQRIERTLCLIDTNIVSKTHSL
jgi:hypothetical protein